MKTLVTNYPKYEQTPKERMATRCEAVAYAMRELKSEGIHVEKISTIADEPYFEYYVGKNLYHIRVELTRIKITARGVFHHKMVEHAGQVIDFIREDNQRIDMRSMLEQLER